ncbi:hypothetical protein K474DRAFT_1664232 [Panus rudis PR-1116 ss-1]|nr:hypothetical protein K474DRAFT_1664232 [Panus rudis PR-1116 ss-1]
MEHEFDPALEPRRELRSRLDHILPPLLASQRSSWEQGVAVQAILETHQFLAQWSDRYTPNLTPYLYGLVHDAVVRQGSDGRLAILLNGDGGSDKGAADPACIGETIYFLLSLLPDDSHDYQRFHDAVENMLNYLLTCCPRASVRLTDGNQPLVPAELLSHRTDGVQAWSDFVYMTPPFLIAAALHQNNIPNPSYDTEFLIRSSLQQVILAAQVLQSPTGEWSHIFDLSSNQFVRKAFWGVGNGWVCGGIIRAFRSLSFALQSTADHRVTLEQSLRQPEIAGYLRDVVEILFKTITACLGHMRPDGLFTDVLDDPTSFVETNLSQQLSYTLYRLLDFQMDTPPHILEILHLKNKIGDARKAEWEVLANKMYIGALSKTDQWGFVRGVCGSPTFDKPGTAAEGQAWAILMEVARAEYHEHNLILGSRT